MHPLGSMEHDVDPSAVTWIRSCQVLRDVDHALRSGAVPLSGTEAQKFTVLIASCDETDLAWVFCSQHAFDVGDICFQDSTHLETQQVPNGHHAIRPKLGGTAMLITVNMPQQKSHTPGYVLLAVPLVNPEVVRSLQELIVWH